MCNANILQLILDVLDEFVTEEKIFTSFDVTKEVRSRTIERVLHRDVKKEVEKFWHNTSQYQRGLIPLNIIGNPSAFIYAPLTANVYDHPLAIKPTSDPDDSEIDDEEEGEEEEDNSVGSTVSASDVIKASRENRLNIPKKILKQVDPVGGSYDISINGTLIPRRPTSNGVVRIGLTSLGIKSGKCKVTIDSNANSILVEEA